MPLRPILPILPDESLGSYLGRAARFHTGQDIYGFLEVIELSRGAVMAPSAADLDRIAALTGHPVAVLQRRVMMSAGPRLRRLGREVFHSEFTTRNQTSFCPACLLEDGAPDSPSGGQRVGRVSWSLEPIRICRRHGIALVRRSNTRHSEKFQHMDEVAPDDAELARLVAAAEAAAEAGAERRAPSALQDYIETRLAGGAGPAWLDAQPIDQAVRACEMIGTLVSHEVTRRLPALSPSALDAAGAVGFRHAERGEAGFREALRQVQDRPGAHHRNGGPQAAFGFLYAALQFNRTGRSPGPIREVVRDHILDTFALEAGTVLFGEVVSTPRKHSVQTLARRFSEHPKTVRRALALAGLIDADGAAGADSRVVDAAPAEALIATLSSALSARALTGHLNCNRMQAELLVRSGLIARIIDEPGRARGATGLVARADADAFLARLLAAGRKVDAPSEGMTDIVTAAGKSRWPVPDIVAALLAVRLTQVECTDPALRFKGVLVSPDEVRRVLARQGAQDHIGVHDAARILDMKPFGITTLVKLRDPSGQPVLREHTVTNAKGVQTRVYSRAEVEAFRDRHVALREIGAVRGLAPKWMKEALDAQGIQPIAPYTGLGRLYYRRDDLARVARA